MTNSLTVFVCSTFADLSVEREAVLDAILRLKLQHDSMEFFGARSQQPLETCLEEVGKSDILVVIVGHRYGSIAPGIEISYSEAEYREGIRLGKPCLVYMRDEDVPVLPKHMERDPKNLKLLENWKAGLGENHTVALFQDAQKLAVQVAADLSRTLLDLQQTAASRAAAEVGGEKIKREIVNMVSEAIERGVSESALLYAIRAAIAPLTASTDRSGRVFLSYAHQDEKIVHEIARRLTESGIDVWFDKDLQPGMDWMREIERELSSAEFVLYFISPSSVRSSWASQEIQVALHRQISGERGARILPILLEDADVPPLLRSIQWLDMRDGNVDKAVRKLIETIKKLSSR
jgi:hypothetical protein